MRTTLIIFVALGLISCGFNQHANDPGLGDNPPFINQTSSTNKQLEVQWHLAQQQISQFGFNLNAFVNTGTTPPDVRALNIQPHGVTVIAVPDIPISELIKSDPRWGTHTDPSGVIVCDGRTAHSCTDVNANTVYAATSLIPGAYQYEFEIIILNALGYDVRFM